jgi:competence protein ComGC
MTNVEIEARRRQYLQRKRVIELILVVLIIASLIAVLVPIVHRIKDGERRANELQQLERQTK